MRVPHYIDLAMAQKVLSDMGIELNERQIKRAAEPDVKGNRKLPFFVDPIDGRLKIKKQSLVDTYRRAQIEAEKKLRY